MQNTFSVHPVLNILLVILAIWAIIWKIYAVWTAVKNDHKKWFLALMVFNTVGILEIFYIFKITKKSWQEVKSDFNRTPSEILSGEKREGETLNN